MLEPVDPRACKAAREHGKGLRPVLEYVLLAYGITWLVWLPLVTGADGLG